MVSDAKARICLYGSKTVLKAFAEFEKLGATMKSAPQERAFVAMVSAMRDDSGLGSNVTLEDIHAILLGYRANRSPDELGE